MSARQRTPLLFAVLFVIGSFTSAFAIDQTGKFAWGGTLGYSIGFGDAFRKYTEYERLREYRTYEVDFSLGIKVKYAINRYLAVEGIVEVQSGEVIEKRGFFGGEVETHNYDWLNLLGSAIFRLPLREKGVPYFSVGIGLYANNSEINPTGQQNAEMGIHLGGGIEYFFKNNLALDVGARFHKIFNSIPSYVEFPADKNITYANMYAGLNLYLGKKHKETSYVR
jgi:opacity protein-like surface antigen